MVSNIYLQMTASDHVRVVLDSVQTKLTGTYLCEVTVTPTFFAMAESANMTVIGESLLLSNSLGKNRNQGNYDGWLKARTIYLIP